MASVYLALTGWPVVIHILTHLLLTLCSPRLTTELFYSLSHFHTARIGLYLEHVTMLIHHMLKCYYLDCIYTLVTTNIPKTAAR
jgi:hypothetical protein